MPNFVFNLKESVETLAERMVYETLIPLFRQLHPERQGWNLSLVNLGATNMVEGASDKGGVGRDIGKMFKRQSNLLAPFRMRDEPAQARTRPAVQEQLAEEEDTEELHVNNEPQAYTPRIPISQSGSEDVPTRSQEYALDIDDTWDEDDGMLDADMYQCDECGAVMPLFAMGAHERWHAQG
jgi:DNA polymerase iota